MLGGAGTPPCHSPQAQVVTGFDAPCAQRGGAVAVGVSPWARDFGAPLLLLAPCSSWPHPAPLARRRGAKLPSPHCRGALGGYLRGGKLGCKAWPPSFWPRMEPSPGGGRLLAVGVRGRWSGRAKPSLSREDPGHQLPPRPRGAPGCIPLPGVLPGGCLAVVAPCTPSGYPGTRHPEVLDAGHPAGQCPGLAELGAPQGPGGASPDPRREPWGDGASAHTPGAVPPGASACGMSRLIPF